MTKKYFLHFPLAATRDGMKFDKNKLTSTMKIKNGAIKMTLEDRAKKKKKSRLKFNKGQ